MVDVQFLGTTADVVDFHGAASAVPLFIVFEGETGVCANGQEVNRCESGEFHCRKFGLCVFGSLVSLVWFGLV